MRKGKTMYQVGIDIGSSTAKTVVMENHKMIKMLLMNTGFNCRETADQIYGSLQAEGFSKGNARYVATGYGRISVPYADRL